jgi:hypothetical protein
LDLILGLDSGRAFRPGLSERERTRPRIDNERSNCDQKSRCRFHRKVQLLAFKSVSRSQNLTCLMWRLFVHRQEKGFLVLSASVCSTGTDVNR